MIPMTLVQCPLRKADIQAVPGETVCSAAKVPLVADGTTESKPLKFGNIVSTSIETCQ